MGSEPHDPGVLRSLAVTADDVVAALEARRQRDATVVLRVTPPFSGRMRARLHVPQAGDADRRSLHISPDRFLAADAPAYPKPGDTGDDLRSDPGVEYTVERHHDRHAARVANWRETVREHFVDSVDVETGAGRQRVEVLILG